LTNIHYYKTTLTLETESVEYIFMSGVGRNNN